MHRIGDCGKPAGGKGGSPALLLWALLAFCACGGNREARAAPEAAASPRAVPRRIISTAPANTEIVVGLGLGGRIVGADAYSLALPGLPAGAAEIDFFHPDQEAVLGLEPDIIISSETNAYGGGGNPYQVLEDSGVRLLFIPTSRGIADIKRDIAAIAEALGAAERGGELIRIMEGEIEEVAAVGRRLTADPGFKRKSLYLEISPFPNPVTLGRETFLDEMIGIIGAVNVFADKTGWIAPGAEAVLDRNPDIILTNAAFIEDPVGEIKARPGFAGLAAVREGRVYAIDGDSSSRPSQHITLALRQMARAVYPEEYAGLRDR
ncbi:MAG: ABC transporter substrate-binding protein [Treponema sp.]|nr:ABC transporter substrate-binding protein [Treponema sp.]